MNQKTREAEEMKELLKEAENHPLMQKIRADRATSTLATRTTAAGKIKALKRERDEVLPKLEADLETKEANYKKTMVDLNAATAEYQKARAVLSGESYCLDNSISTQEQILIESADPALDEAIVFFREKIDYLRSPGRISTNRLGSEENIFTELKTVKMESNVGAVKSALEYCRAAIEELERMKLSPMLDVKKIEAIKNGIPDIGIFTESTGERPTGKLNINPFSMLPSDSEMDWKIGNLNEKFKKLMA